MQRDTNVSALPALTADLLRDSGLLIDNLIADLWKQVGMKTLLNRAAFVKRSGTPIHEVVYCLVMWVWLKAGSMGLFARESLHTFSTTDKDALYTGRAQKPSATPESCKVLRWENVTNN
jgi:hypothetical protein